MGTEGGTIEVTIISLYMWRGTDERGRRESDLGELSLAGKGRWIAKRETPADGVGPSLKGG